MAKAELILELGLEGGGLSVYRTPTGSGDWQFHVTGSTIDLDETDDEAWRSWGTEPFPSLSEALRSVTKDGSWVLSSSRQDPPGVSDNRVAIGPGRRGRSGRQAKETLEPSDRKLAAGMSTGNLRPKTHNGYALDLSPVRRNRSGCKLVMLAQGRHPQVVGAVV